MASAWFAMKKGGAALIKKFPPSRADERKFRKTGKNLKHKVRSRISEEISEKFFVKVRIEKYETIMGSSGG